MVIQKKATRGYVQTDIVDEAAIKRVINRGGSVAEGSKPTPDENEVRFTLRVPSAFMQKIDEMRRARMGKVSLNQMIVELIGKALES